jgi:hypothetical protein
VGRANKVMLISSLIIRTAASLRASPTYCISFCENLYSGLVDSLVVDFYISLVCAVCETSCSVKFFSNKHDGEMITNDVCWERPDKIFFFFVKDSSHKIFCPLYFLSGLVIHLYAALFRHRKLREVTPPGMRKKKEEESGISRMAVLAPSKKERMSPGDLISGWPTCFLVIRNGKVSYKREISCRQNRLREI